MIGWTCAESDLFKSTLSPEQMGRLFFAVMDHAKTGKETPVDEDILFPYKMKCFQREANTLGKVFDKKQFGDLIAKKRKEKGISRQELADTVGIALTTLGPYERGEKLPQLDVALKIAASLGLSIDSLAYGGERF